MCKVKGCERNSMYQEQDVCQMHYFRFMRNGSYELKPKTRKERLENPAGYQKLYKPKHCLAGCDGYVYEHRYVYFEELSKDVEICAMCGTEVSWDDCHIDHIDSDVKNNKPENLRALCRSCNVFSGHTATSMGKMFLTVNGRTLTPTAWARQSGVKVSAQTIRRRKSMGFSDHEAVFGDKATHKLSTGRTYEKKTDGIRGITHPTNSQ